jgi:type II secretory pathway component PulC
MTRTRRDLLVALFALAIGIGGCAREPEPAEPNPQTTTPPAATPPKATPPKAAPATLAVGLDAALTLAVLAPPTGGTTYRVDAFVPALVVAALAEAGPEWFSPYAGKPDKVDYEVAGFVTSSAAERAGLHRLGLREGDIVEEVNGVPATDVARIEAALAGADHGLTVGIFREEYSLVLSYRFEPGLSWSRTLEARASAANADLGAAPSDPTAGAGPEPIAALDPAGETPDPSGGGEVPRAGGATPTGRPQPGAPAPSSAPKTTPKSPPTPAPSTSSSVRCANASSCTIRRSYFDSMTSSMSKLESQATIVPAIRDDVFSGYKLKWIRPGSAVAQLGFRSGDKVTHVNGRDLTDDSQALALYLGLSSTNNYKVRYVRGSSTLTKSIQIQ